MTSRLITGVLCAALLAVSAGPGAAQVNDQLSAYTGANAEGYLEPLANAFGAALNDAFFYSANIPTTGLRISLEFPVMGVLFSDDDRFFTARTEGGFSPSQTTSAPTIVGPGEAKFVDGDGGTSYAFPGGFDLNSFGLTVPQLRVAGIAGTEAVVRYFAIETGDAELGDISLYGIGLRHSISQYLEEFPVDLAAGFMWQSFSVGENDSGDDLISSDAFSIGVQASRALPLGFAAVEPFAGLALDTFGMSVEYESEVSGDTVDLEFDTDTTVHLTIGTGFNLPFAHVFGAWNFASTSSFNFGLVLGNVGLGL